MGVYWFLPSVRKPCFAIGLILPLHNDLKGKQHLLHHNKQKQALKGLSMKTCCVKPFEDEVLRFCFCVVSPEKTLFLQAEGDVDKRAWMQLIQASSFENLVVAWKAV